MRSRASAGSALDEVLYAQNIASAKAQRRKALPRFWEFSLRLCALAGEIIGGHSSRLIGADPRLIFSLFNYNSIRFSKTKRWRTIKAQLKNMQVMPLSWKHKSI